jgi:solute carrier family 25, member 38
MSTLHEARSAMAKTAYFATSSPSVLSSSVLPTLTVQGNLLAGAVVSYFLFLLINYLTQLCQTRTVVGTILNPLAVLKARYEVCTTASRLSLVDNSSQSDLYAYRSLWQAFCALARGGPSHLFRGATASAMRDAPYAGLFLVSYEQLKREGGAFHLTCNKFPF